MSKIIEVEVKSVYGNTLIYPKNDTARILAKIAGKKTLSSDDLNNAILLGLVVREVSTPFFAPLATLNAA